jgi:hypothetical protein
MEQASARELQTGARIADALVYAAGVAGIVAGGLLFRAGQPGFAVVAWALTFVAGAALRLAAAMARALAKLLLRTEQLEAAIDDLRRSGTTAPPPPPQRDAPPDPYRRWGGWH